MSEPYQLYSILPEPTAARTVVLAAHEVLTRAGAVWDEDSFVQRMPAGSEDPEPEPLESAETLLALADWPALGSAGYVLDDVPAGVYFVPGPAAGTCDAVVISFSQRTFESRETTLVPLMRNIAAALHERLHALRTFMDWGLDFKGFSVEQEIARLRTRRYDGTYKIIDLQ